MSEDLDDLVENLREPSAWARVVFMLGFAIVLYMVIIPLTLLLALAQALFSVFTGEDNDNLRDFGASLLAYISQVVGFLTFNSDERPFPFSDFPEEDGGEGGKAPTQQAKAESPTQGEAAVADKPAAKKTAKQKSSSKKATKKSTKKVTKKTTKATKKKTPSKTTTPGKEQASGSGKGVEKPETDDTKE